MNATNKKNAQRLNDLIAINLQTDQELAQYGKWTRKKVETMIVVDVHARDVFDEMVKKKIKDIEDFEWSKQARFYWRDDLDVAKVHVADVDFSYCNEYLGVKERLADHAAHRPLLHHPLAGARHVPRRRPPAPPARARPRRPRTWAARWASTCS